jgi:glutamate synthase (NADPH/NADH) large chain
VRNSGATLVVEGVGDHALEYMTGGQVVILGEHGRNLAAGMSGGIAYVLDLKVARVNPELVAVEAPSGADREFLQRTVKQHFEETGSQTAALLLADWAGSIARFAKIMPTDYKRVLTAKAAAERAGLSEPETLEKIMEASHG